MNPMAQIINKLTEIRSIPAGSRPGNPFVK